MADEQEAQDLHENEPREADAAGAEATGGDVPDPEQALESVERAAGAVSAAVAEAGDGDESAVELPDFGPAPAEAKPGAGAMSLLDDVSLRVKVELGRTMMYVEDVLRLNTDSVIELDKAAGDPVDIYVNNRHVARGEVLVLNENFCVRVSEIISIGPGEEEPAP